jgi:hypothetical protein
MPIRHGLVKVVGVIRSHGAARSRPVDSSDNVVAVGLTYITNELGDIHQVADEDGAIRPVDPSDWGWVHESCTIPTTDDQSTPFELCRVFVSKRNRASG